MWFAHPRRVLACLALTFLVACGEDSPSALAPTSSGGGSGGDGGTSATGGNGGGTGGAAGGSIGGGGSGGSSSGGTGGSGGAGGAGGEGGAGGDDGFHVLFVGNSYTAVNNLPSLVAGLSTAGTPSFVVSSVTPGGTTLQTHLNSSGAVPAIQQGGWDAVVLQGQSYEALYDPTTFQSAALGLDVEIDAVGAQTVFFETWAREAGHSLYNETWSGGNPAAMQAGLRAAYQTATTATNGVMAAVGDGWEITLANHPAIQLHSGDGSHPAIAGSYLAACVFYLTLTGQQAIPSPAAAPSGLSESDATTLRAVAEALP